MSELKLCVYKFLSLQSTISVSPLARAVFNSIAQPGLLIIVTKAAASVAYMVAMPLISQDGISLNAEESDYVWLGKNIFLDST